MLGIFGVVLTLVLLMILAFKGFNVIMLAPILAIIAMLFASAETGHANIMATYTEVFMVRMANYIKSNYPVFLLGAILGTCLDKSGAADSISRTITEKLGADKAILSVVLAASILTYGGVSLFVVAFAVYPIGASLFRQADLPKRLLPGSIALGSFTYTMTALPGTPQIQNAIPMKYFGTDAYAAPILGFIATIIIFGLGMLWLTTRAAKAKAAGEGYGDHKGENVKIKDYSQMDLPSFIVALAPMITVIVLNLILSRFYYPGVDGAYLEGYNTTLQTVSGTWSLIIALVVGIILTLLLNLKRFDSILGTLDEGVKGSFGAIMNTAAMTGYGGVISTLPAFAAISAGIMGISQNVLLNEAISVSVLAGVTGSASGGMSIALEALGGEILQKAAAAGIDPQVCHRVASIASGGLDSLPHNGAVITLLTITGLNHKQSYLDIGMCTVIIPTLSVIAIIIAAQFGIV